MKCDAFQNLLDELLDRREIPEADMQIREHVADCKPCRLTLRGHAVLLKAVQQGARPAVRRSQSTSMAMPLAAAVLFAALLAWQRVQPNMRIHEQHYQSPVAAVIQHSSTSELSRTNSSLPSSPSSTATSVSAMHPVVSLQLITRADWSETLSAVPVPFVPLLDVPTLETRWIETLTQHMAPVQDSMSSTFRVLRRTLSASAKPSPVNG